jgi:transposase
MTEYFIALDVHQAFTEIAVVTRTGRIVRRERCDTKIPSLLQAIDAVRRPRRLTFEEGPLAGWLSRELQAHVDELLVCEPRRNHLIAKDSDKDDPLDAERLAHLYRGGYLKPVHQAESLERSLLKQHVSFYHDRVRERVRQGNQLTAQFRRHGCFPKSEELLDPDERQKWLRSLPASKLLRGDLGLLLDAYDLLLAQEEQIRSQLIRAARWEEPVRRFLAMPGFSWIRAATFYVYIDTPHRFRGKSALWRYCGIGLERRHSGQGPMRTRLCDRGNRRLKNVLLGAALSAITRADNPFADKYRYWTEEEGMRLPEARRNVARCQAAVLWSLWKTGHEYDPQLVRGVGLTKARGLAR